MEAGGGVTLTLSVAAGWWDHVVAVARSYPHLVPVVKGNGYGFGRNELAHVAAATAAGVTVEAAAIHLPLATDDVARRAEVETWLAALEPHADAVGHALWLSHLSADTVAELATTWPDWTFVMRSGSALWHGDKHHLHLGATVRAVHDIAAGETAGYHHTTAPADGHLVVIGAGTAHGVTALPDGRSPFHFERRRLPLLEAPHMHSSIVFIDADDRSLPPVGATVDVQRPLAAVVADTVSFESPPPTR